MQAQTEIWAKKYSLQDRVCAQHGYFETMHFGEFLRALREERGLTQEALASLANVSDFTIRRAEGSEKCVWRRGTALDVYSALNKVTRMPPQASDAFLDATDLTQALVDATDNAKRLMKGGHSGEPAPSIISPDENHAHNWLAALIRERGVTTVLHWLEAIAATNGIQMPPRLPTSGPMRGPQWAIYREIQYPDGWVVTERGPVQPPAAPAQGKPGEQPKRAKRM